ncbi:MAG: hypothetical protein ACE5HT_15825 [Gemmatimonadales bacterium]
MTGRVVVGRVACVALAVIVSACAANRAPPPPVPIDSPFYGNRSLSPYDAALRHYLTLRDSTALPLLLRSGPKDALIRKLNEGLFLHRLGRYRASNEALQAAERLARKRYTKSISQNIAAFLINDKVLDYYPSAQEWSMIHYYGMMNYLKMGDVENALVEARKANELLRRYANDNPGRSFTNPAAVQYVAGMLQWSAGEDNDAVVSLRQSLLGYEQYEENYGVAPPLPVVKDLVKVATELGFDDVAQTTRATYLDDRARADDGPDSTSVYSGELLVIIENGFVSHRTEQKLYIPILASEKDSVLSGDLASAIIAAAKVIVRTLVVMNELSRAGVDYPSHEDGVVIATAGSAVGLDLISLAWPSYELDAKRAGNIRVSVDRRVARPVLLQDLSAIEVRDFEEEKPTILLRMVARGLLKEIAVTEAEAAGKKAAGDVGEFLGRVTTRGLAAATERADTRSWSILPAELLLARFALPAGLHTVRIGYDGLQGRREELELEVKIDAGRATTQTVALVGGDEGNERRLRRARRGVRYREPKVPKIEPRKQRRRKKGPDDIEQSRMVTSPLLCPAADHPPPPLAQYRRLRPLRTKQYPEHLSAAPPHEVNRPIQIKEVHRLGARPESIRLTQGVRRRKDATH